MSLARDTTYRLVQLIALGGAGVTAVKVTGRAVKVAGTHWQSRAAQVATKGGRKQNEQSQMENWARRAGRAAERHIHDPQEAGRFAVFQRVLVQSRVQATLCKKKQKEHSI